jgi:hypothetical protein
VAPLEAVLASGLILRRFPDDQEPGLWTGIVLLAARSSKKTSGRPTRTPPRQLTQPFRLEHWRRTRQHWNDRDRMLPKYDGRTYLSHDQIYLHYYT